MSRYIKSPNVQRTDTALKRVGRAQDVIDVLRNGRLTREQLADELDVSPHALQGLLTELQEYGVLRKVRERDDGRLQEYTVAHAGNIESFKADLLQSPQASD